MKILVRLPNWLGDMVMSLGFLNALQQVYPGASISVIAKKGIDSLLDFFPAIEHRFIFSKEQYAGIKGAWKFGRMIRETSSFDLFFCLPESFSSAVMGFASGAKKRIGYEKELRFLLLTNAYKKTGSLHRVQEYVDLLTQYSKKNILIEEIRLNADHVVKKNQVIVNINSEASSRRLPVQKAVELLTSLKAGFHGEIVLIGGKADISYTESVTSLFPDSSQIINLAGKTSLGELVNEILSSKAVLTVDSGPAHVANALGVNTIVLFGAGNEKNTGPFNTENGQVVRLGKLPCEPCVKNKCLLYGSPRCLELLNDHLVVQTLLTRLK